MANKKILVSNNSGSIEELSFSNIFYDDTFNRVFATNIIVNSISSSYQNNGFILLNNNIISSSISFSPLSGNILRFSNSSYSSFAGKNFGGDISGSVDGITRAVSIANVSEGVLSYDRGGTGLGASVNGLFIKGSGNTISTLSTNNSNDVIGLFNSPTGPYWAIDSYDATTNYKPRLDVYTSPGTWTKKGNPRFLTILTIGGGGGGSGGSPGSNPSNPPSPPPAGAGGGGGGISLVTIEAGAVQSATITIGAGGGGGAALNSPGGSTPGAAGTAGGTTSFTTPSLNIYSTGGAGGRSVSIGIGGLQGLGSFTNTNTQKGGDANGGAGGNGYFTSGGGAGAKNGFPAGKSGLAFYTNISTSFGEQTPTSNKIIFTDNYYLNNSTTPTNTNENPYFGAGAAGGSAGSGGSASSGKYGGGGGGGGNRGPTPFVPATAASNGGDGGSGIVFVYSH